MLQYQGDLHKRLWEALSCYEWRMDKQSRLSEVRKEDVLYLRQCITLIVDERLLEREVKSYLATLRTSSWFWLVPKSHSVLRDMLLMVIHEERARFFYPSYIQPSSADTQLLIHD